MLATFVGVGLLAYVDEFLPEESWAATFARELVFMVGGRAQHSREVMGRLLEDPTIGPLGGIVCAQLLEKIDPPTSQRFLRKARAQATAEAFRHDWRLALGSSSAVGQTGDRVIAGLAAIDPKAEDEMAELLPPEMADWMRRFLAHLRLRPADQPVSEWVAPQMDRLWDTHLGPNVIERIERALNPPADPAAVAATVDGVPVPRFLVRLLEEQHRGPFRGIPLPEPNEAKPWTADPALACAIRLTLAADHARQRYGEPSPEQVGAYLDTLFPRLKGKDDGEWIRQTGLDRARLGQWAATVNLGQQFLREQAAAVEKGADEQALRAYHAAHVAALGRKVSFANIFVMPQSPTPAELARSHRLAAALGQVVQNGLPANVLQAATQRDPGARCQLFIQREISLASLQPQLMKAIEKIEVGGVTVPMELGKGIAVIQLGARNEGTPPEFETVKASVRNLWLAEQAEATARQWFEAREARAAIKLLETPAAEDAAPPPSAFEQLLGARPDDAVALLATFWEKAVAEDAKGAGAALDRLLAAGPGHAPLSGTLIDPLARKNLRDFALRCLEKAAEIRRDAARNHIDALVQLHAKHGCKAHDILKEIRQQVFGDDAEPL